MKLYSIWQPLDDEDQRTALVFGFLRHAPPEHGLARWLTTILGRPVTVDPLEPSDFWPRYRSHMPDCAWTVPELVFEASDEAGPFHVIVEAKIATSAHTDEQLAREIVDTAHERPATRIVMIALGADYGVPLDQPQWQAAADAALARHGPPAATVEVRYSSWAQIADAIEAAAKAVPALSIYAEDVIAQMRFKGMLGYKGAPMSDDLEGGLTIVNAFEYVNRVAISARQFYRFLHDTPGFRALALGSYWAQYEMRRNGTSTSLNQDEEWFEVSMFMSAYKQAGWPEGAGAFVAFYFDPEGDEPLLQTGAFTTTWNALLGEFDYSGPVDGFEDSHLGAYAGSELPLKTAGANSEWLYDERPWRPGEPDADIAWALTRLTDAIGVFPAAAA